MSNLVTDYIQKRRGEPGLFSFEYDLLPKFLPLHGPGIIVAALKKINVSGCASSKKEKCRSNINSTFLSL